MRGILITSAVVAGLTGCNQVDDRVSFDGQFYRGKSAKVKDAPRQFTASAGPVSSSLQGAREAAAYEGTKYCITEFGTSRIAWIVGPEADEADLTLDRGTLTLTGECKP